MLNTLVQNTDENENYENYKVGYKKGSRQGYNLIGHKFGRLTVLKDTMTSHPKRGRYWLCLCSCGELTKVTTSHLVHGNTKSCGCLAREVAKINAKKRKQNCKPKPQPKKQTKERNIDKKVTKNVIKKDKPNKIPNELKNISSRIVENGLFQVYENGRIFRFNGATECKVVITNGYKSVSTMVNGIQKHYYVHRLIAKAFIPNPEDKPVVTFKDGNPLNTEINNLIWATPYEIRQREEQKRRQSLPECKLCGSKTQRHEDEICSKCQRKINRKKKREENKKRRMKNRISNVSDIRLEFLTPKQQEVIKLALKGYSIGEIAKMQGVSRQNISSTIKRAKMRSKKQRKQVVNVNNNVDDVNDVKALRKLHGLKIKDLADLLDMTASSYSNKERGKTEFTITEAIKLCELYDKKLDDLFG